MLKLKNISYDTWLWVLCLLLVTLSLYSVAVSNYVLIYLIFFIAFAALITGYFILNKQNLFKMLFFFVPLSVPVDLMGEDAQIQLPTEPLVGMLTLLFLAYLIRMRKELIPMLKHPISIVLLLELCWMIVCSFASELMIVSFKFTFVRFCYISTFFILSYFWFKQEEKPYKLFVIYGIGMIIPMINGFIFHAKLDFTQRTAYRMPQPYFNDHTVYGAVLAFVIIALIIILYQGSKLIKNPIHRFLLSLLLLVMMVAEFFAYSRAAWLSLACSLIFYIAIRFKITGNFFLVATSILTVIVVLNWDTIIGLLEENKAISNKEDLALQVKSMGNLSTDVSNKERVNRWKCAIRMGNSKPFFGFGPRTYKFFYGNFQVRQDLTYTSTFIGNRGHAHSDYLSYLAETGYTGFVLHILLYLTILYKGLNLMRTCMDPINRSYILMAVLGILTYAVHSVFNGFMEEEKMASLVFMSMALMVYIAEKEKQKSIS
ncbi:MAG: O-antigen ligase family protein [Cytophagaceae bacterium]|nr:O-antigen ligase family protein [Cytophagaceae bacterium]